MSQALAVKSSSMVDNAKTTLGIRELTIATCNVEEIIVQGTKQKRQILQEYKDAFSSGHSDSIVTKKTGKHSYIDSGRPIT